MDTGANKAARTALPVVTAENFISTTAPESYSRTKEGAIIWDNFMRLSATSQVNTAGENGTA
jgi:hypothetical protein